MNSIRRPRRRPRKLSVNFRTLWWVIQREAFIRIWFPMGMSHGNRRRRKWLCSCSSTFLTRQAQLLLADQPSRRYFE